MEISRSYERTATGSMDAEAFFDGVYDYTYNQILKYVIIKTSNADEVDDIVQNVYRNFFARITRKGFADIKAPHAFIIRLADKELSRHYKARAVKREMEADSEMMDETVPAENIPFEEMMDDREELNKVWQIVKDAPLLSYKAFVLYYNYDMPVAEIARNLCISQQNVKNRLHRTRNSVRKALRGE